MTIADQYASDVISGKVPACSHIKKMCERYVSDLKSQKTYYFDAKIAQAYIDFMQLFRAPSTDAIASPRESPQFCAAYSMSDFIGAVVIVIAPIKI